MEAVQSFDGSAGELQRSKYILDFLQTGSVPHACKVSGLSRHAHQRIVQMFAEKGHFFDSPRPGRPVIYTEEMMRAAYDRLLDDQEGSMTGKRLRGKLVEDGVLHATADMDTFMQHFKQYVVERGHTLTITSTSTEFYIAVPDVKARLDFARTMTQELRDRSLNHLIWADETILEEYPHPKGMRCL